VRCSSVGRFETTPFRIVPHSGKVSEHDAEPPLAESGHVFEEDNAGSDLPDNASDICPDPPLIVGVLALACGAEGLTGRAASEDIHAATPRAAVEGGNVSPDRSLSQGARFHLRDHVGDGEGFPLHHTDRASASDSCGDTSLEPAVSAEETKDCGGTCAHDITPPLW